MRWQNTSLTYGLISISVHWLVAIAVITLFVVGVWMVDLGYYDTWYHKAPFLHKSAGVLLLAMMLFRLLWRILAPQPQAIATQSRLVQLAAKAGHLLMYFLLFAIMIAGYLISTADGEPIDVFGWFSVPALISGLPDQADIAGLVHKYLAWTLMAVVIGHALAAFKHHFFDKDATLVRMFGKEER